MYNKLKIAVQIALVLVLAVVAVRWPEDAKAKGTQSISVALDGVNLKFSDADGKPFTDSNNRVLVPLRFVSESLGLQDVKWDEAASTVSIRSDSLDISLAVGSKTATVNGAKKDIGSAAVQKNGRVYVPLRFVSEALGRRVVWDGANSTAHIWNLISDKELEEGSHVQGYGTTVSMPAHVGYYHFIAENGKLTFSDPYWDGPKGPYTNYSISEKLTPGLSKKAYQMVKYLADDEQYTDAKYFPETAVGTPAALAITYAVGSRAVDNDNYYFQYAFLEKQPITSFASKNVSMRLIVNSLYWYSKDGTKNVKVENKLRMSLVALYGDTQGIAIYNWIMGFYNKTQVDNADYEKLKTTKVSKTFGNVQVDFDGTGIHLLTFSFTNKG